MKRFSALLLILCTLLTLAGCGGRQVAVPGEPDPTPAETPEPPAPTPGPEPDVEVDDTPAERLILDAVAGMTLEEKVGQLFFVRCPEDGVEEKLTQYHLGGVLLFTRDYQDESGGWLTREAFTGKLARYQAAAARGTGVPLFIGSDEEGGTVTRASRDPNLFADRLPSPQALYRAGGAEEIVRQTANYNAALLALGINVNFAPVCDVSTNPRDFIYDRSFGQDAAATSDYVAAAVHAMNLAGIACVLKHFPGYGSNPDTHTGAAVDRRPYSTFEESDFLPFAAGIDAGAPFVLVSHNVVKCMDDSLPASLSPVWHGVLRGVFGFEGVILTDDLAMDAVKAYARDGSAAVLAILAGNDMIVTTDFETQIPQVIAAVEDGTIPIDTIDAAAARVLRTKYELGLMNR